MTPLPTTVVSGYLGSGKTSLINHLLANAGGRRVMVMVNDFGDLDIDASLLESADEDTLVLSNGCICCTMGTELLYALSDALDRRPRPDWLVIEASGVADPAKIAAAALAEPEMRYAGIVLTADAANIANLLSDKMIGAQVAAQVRAADLVLLTKTDIADEAAARAALSPLTGAPVLVAVRGAAPIELLAGAAAAAPAVAAAHDHGAVYARWSTTGGAVSRAALSALLADPPVDLYRLKGHVVLKDGGAVEAHLVGRTFEIKPAEAPETALVGIGLKPGFDPAVCEARWRACMAED